MRSRGTDLIFVKSLSQLKQDLSSIFYNFLKVLAPNKLYRDIFCMKIFENVMKIFENVTLFLKNMVFVILS